LVTHLAMKMDTEKVFTQANSMSKTLDYDKANCLGLNTDYFYMTDKELELEGVSLRVIRRICFDCPIQKECAEYGFTYEKYGTFGGYTSKERELVIKGHFNTPEIQTLFDDLGHLRIIRLGWAQLMEFKNIKPTHIVPAYWKKEGIHE